jgi:hypothetical protein
MAAMIANRIMAAHDTLVIAPLIVFLNETIERRRRNP